MPKSGDKSLSKQYDLDVDRLNKCSCLHFIEELIAYRYVECRIKITL